MVAAHDGRVLAAGRKFDPFIGWLGSLGPHTRRMDRLDKWWELPITVIVDDGDGYRAIYAHFNAVSVKPGQLIRAGQQIGWEGATGFATGCHVHFGLFSMLETKRFELRPDVQARTKYPRWEIARIDPLLVLPALAAGQDLGPVPAPPPAASPASSPTPTPTRHRPRPRDQGVRLVAPVAPGDERVRRQARQRLRQRCRRPPVEPLDGQQRVRRGRLRRSGVDGREVDRHPARLGRAQRRDELARERIGLVLRPDLGVGAPAGSPEQDRPPASRRWRG